MHSTKRNLLNQPNWTIKAIHTATELTIQVHFTCTFYGGKYVIPENSVEANWFFGSMDNILRLFWLIARLIQFIYLFISLYTQIDWHLISKHNFSFSIIQISNQAIIFKIPYRCLVQSQSFNTKAIRNERYLHAIFVNANGNCWDVKAFIHWTLKLFILDVGLYHLQNTM